MTDPWKYTLEYFEFLDDMARWTHLDQLLLRHPPQSLHLANHAESKTSSSSSSSPQRDRMMESLQVFLEERRHVGQDDNTNDSQAQGPSCHLHNQVTLDTTKLESAVSQLLLQDADVQLAFRGNVQLSQGKLLQQGLALWLQAEDLYSPTVAGEQWCHSLKIQPGVLNSHLVMDRTAAACIHLLPPPNAGVATVVGGQVQNNSLWGLLSQPCATSMGKAMLQVWLRQPLIDPAAILYRQDAVTALVQGMGKDSLKEALQAFSGVDLPQLASLLAMYEHEAVTNTKKPLKALYQLYLLSSTQLPQLVEAMESFDISSSQLLQDSFEQLSQLLMELDRCQGLVEAVLDLDSAPREYLVKPSFSSDLQDLYQELQQVQSQADDELLTMQDIWAQASGDDKTQVRLETCTVNSSDSTSTTSWQFRLPNTNATKILETLATEHGVKLHRVLKNGVYFSSKHLRALSASYQQLSTQYSNNSLQVVQDAMQVATTYQTVVERAAQVVSTLDVVMALARVAAYSPHGYCKPRLTNCEDGGIELKAARHPCVELQDDIEFIPNDISLQVGGDSCKNFLLVTGPNMGGKSTYIRALGAVVCLAQIGSYVPAQAATINICHSLLARVGAGDLQERGISTFMAEMLEASSILRTATHRSLVIIDELGRGTSTFDGYGLARAISEYLQRRVGCMTVFATHFHELTHIPGVQNCHVTAQKSSTGLTFLYQVRPGPCLESFGIQVAEMAGVPAAVIQDAKRKATELENFGSGPSKKRKDDDDFVQRFCSLDLPSLLQGQGGDTADSSETRDKLLQLLLAQ